MPKSVYHRKAIPAVSCGINCILETLKIVSRVCGFQTFATPFLSLTQRAAVLVSGISSYLSPGQAVTVDKRPEYPLSASCLSLNSAGLTRQF